MSAPADLDASAELLRALAHPVRLAILRAITEGELSVGAIEAASGIGQPALSQQLAVLRGASLVETRREAKQVFYRIDQDRIAHVSALLDSFAGTLASSKAQVQVPTPRRPTAGSAVFARVYDRSGDRPA